MSYRLLERVLLVASVVFTGSAFVVLHRRVEAHGVSGPALPGMLLSSPRASGDSLEAAMAVVARHNLFRSDRMAADVSTLSTPNMPMPMNAPMSNRPRLQLRGILGGPPWDALVEGIPGHDGAVVIRVGQSLSGITVKAVRHDSAFVAGFDTTWALSLRRTW
ncbi:MAG: hypothetical protein JWM95_1633 [Gemmatimonadetes bacterium]|nr:hypothetical protein [Gemmatimonadota bacterium]